MQPSATDSMPSFGRLLVATDFSAASQAACRTAIDTCIALRAGLVILHVLNPDAASPPAPAEPAGNEPAGNEPAGDGSAGNGPRPETPGHDDRCRASLEELRQQALRAGVDCEAILGNGTAAATILEMVAAKKIDLVLMGTSALHGLDRIVFDSTTEAVLRKAPCPVLTVGPRAQSAGTEPVADGPVVFATDFHFVTIHAIRFAADFSRLTGSPLHCLHVMPRALEACTRCQDVPAIMSEALQQLAEESGVVVGAPICATTYGSEVSTAVVDYARQQKARLIVLGVRKASLLAAQHLHIAYRILTEAPCPVLTMAFASQPEAAVAELPQPASAAL